jgi:hypothetical protein
MTISAQPVAFFAEFKPIRALRWVFAAAVFAAIAAPGAADARIARAGAYDGVWNVVFATRAGHCSSTNSVPFTVSGHRVSSAGGGKVTGASAATAPCRSEYLSACRSLAAAAGSPAIRVSAGGPELFPATAAAAPGRPRGGSLSSRP